MRAYYVCLTHAGESCKWKFRRKIKPLGSLSAALQHFELPLPGFLHKCAQTEQPSCCVAGINTDPSSIQVSLMLFQKQFEQLPVGEQVTVIESLFAITRKAANIKPTPTGFVTDSISVMQHLQENQKTNVLAGTAYVLGSMRPDHSDSLLPIQRMPFGLIEHCINFYSAKSLR